MQVIFALQRVSLAYLLFLELSPEGGWLTNAFWPCRWEDLSMVRICFCQDGPAMLIKLSGFGERRNMFRK